MPSVIDQAVDLEVHRPMRVHPDFTLEQMWAARGVVIPEGLRRMTHDNVEETDQSGLQEGSRSASS